MGAGTVLWSSAATPGSATVPVAALGVVTVVPGAPGTGAPGELGVWSVRYGWMVIETDCGQFLTHLRSTGPLARSMGTMTPTPGWTRMVLPASVKSCVALMRRSRSENSWFEPAA